ARMRATMSEGPPGELATTTRTGRSGNAASAELTRNSAGAATRAPAALMTWRRDTGARTRLIMTSSHRRFFGERQGSSVALGWWPATAAVAEKVAGAAQKKSSGQGMPGRGFFGQRFR